MKYKNSPPLQVGDWIRIGETKCIVSKLHDDTTLGIGEVVFCPEKPTNLNFDWNGKEFIFPETGDFGGYADRNPRLTSFVRELKNRK